MRSELLGRAAELARREEPAREALTGGKPRLVVLTPDPGAERRSGVDFFPMTCHSGGSVEIYFDPILPAPRLLVFGVSPTARALARLGQAMGYTVVAADPAAEPALFPTADRVLTDLRDPALAAGAPPFAPFAVVATMGEGDEEAIRAALGLGAAYLGVVASSRRFAQIRQTLAAGGVASEALDAIHSPAGLALGARTPEEIALSVLAQIVAGQRTAAPPQEEAKRQEAAPAEAVDPVCGMRVAVAGARHTAKHASRNYFFCCCGCRAKFIAGPERYLRSAGGSLA